MHFSGGGAEMAMMIGARAGAGAGAGVAWERVWVGPCAGPAGGLSEIAYAGGNKGKGERKK